MIKRYFFQSIIGDGGEFSATAYPEDIADPMDEPYERDDGFAVWIHTNKGSVGAVRVGAEMAANYFERRADAHPLPGSADLWHEPRTGGS